MPGGSVDGGAVNGDASATETGACATSADIATADAGPAWACRQLACAAQLTACAADCSCESAVASALACGAASATCFAGAFTALASDPVVTALANCLAANQCTIGADSCKPGKYEGALGGLYSSHLTVVGADIPVTGSVDLTLVPAGSAGSQCVVDGTSEDCGNVLTIHNGTVTGTMDGLFPLFCTLSGALDCAARRLVGGWMECTYCVGSLADGGMSCGAGIGGRFAGPATADCFSTSTGGDGGAGAIDGGGIGPPAFGTVPPPLGANQSNYDPGAWNGAESLAGYSGSGSLPDGGTLGDYLSDAGYGRVGVTNDFGGYGWWYATYQHP